MITSILKLASVPAYANIVDFGGFRGYWTTNQDNHKIFLDSKSNRIVFPRALHGKNPGDVSSKDFAAIPQEESGDAVYKLWLADFNRKKSVDKLFNGFEFTNEGKLLVDRLKKFFIKSKLDNVAVYSLDPAYSIKPEMFDKLMMQTSIDKVRTLGRSIAKKYRIVIELMRAAGRSRVANKIDNDFYYHWNKLEPLFDFNPADYNPKKATNEPDEEQEKSQTETLQNIANSFLEESRNVMDPQMGEFMNALSDFMKVVGKNNFPLAQKAYENMASILMKYIGSYGKHPISLAAEKIIQLPSFILLHHKLFEDATP